MECARALSSYPTIALENSPTPHISSMTRPQIKAATFHPLSAQPRPRRRVLAPAVFGCGVLAACVAVPPPSATTSAPAATVAPSVLVVWDPDSAPPAKFWPTVDVSAAIPIRLTARGAQRVPDCTLYTAEPEASIDRTPLPVGRAQLEAGIHGPGLWAHQSTASNFLPTIVVEWEPQTTIVGQGRCDSVTHFVERVTLGVWLDAPAEGGGRCDLAPHTYVEALTSECAHGAFLELTPFSVRTTISPPVASSAMVHVAGGSFRGSPIRGFWLDRDEVSDEAMLRCILAGVCAIEGAPVSPTYRARPAVAGSSERYCAWVGKRLPTLREWRWAAQGREEQRPFPWGHANPTFARVNAQDAEHSFGSPAEGTEESPRAAHHVRTAREDGAFLRFWVPAPDPPGARPLGTSRDGVRDMLGNVSEVVVDVSAQPPELLAVGGYFHSLLPSHPVLEELADPALVEAELAILTSNGPPMGAGLNAVGVRCAADAPPPTGAYDGEQVSIGALSGHTVPGLHRFDEAASICKARGGRLPTASELAGSPETFRGGAPYWNSAGEMWKEGGSMRVGDRLATAGCACVEE